ncbi:alpha/beta fold hydrolase [Streptomyces sp. x-80]|uniref:alpha/beta fold hydrolase n=1 Tax=Streptomyces sp. x-80 TaxID=2789282 RepID=UPI00397F318B
MWHYQYAHFAPTRRMVPAHIPGLVITGAEDSQFPAHLVRKMADAIKRGTFRVLPHTGHLAVCENPDEANAEVDAFPAGLSAVAA